MVSSFIHFNQSLIHYRKAGTGPAIMVCFHGFGEHAKTFDQLAAQTDNHLLIAFDLPFHGETDWNSSVNVSIADLLKIIRLCPEVGDADFSLMGYSMGGRIALTVYETIPQKITGIILLAPDGLVVNPWYWFATQTKAGNRLFHYTMNHPGWFLNLLNLASRFGMVNQSVRKFVQTQVGDIVLREKIYNVWTSFRSFRPQLEVIKKQIVKHQTPVYLVFGKYDRIIRSEKGERFIQSISPFGKVDIIESGHQLLHPGNIKAIKKAMDFCLNKKNSSGS